MRELQGGFRRMELKEQLKAAQAVDERSPFRKRLRPAGNFIGVQQKSRISPPLDRFVQFLEEFVFGEPRVMADPKNEMETRLPGLIDQLQVIARLRIFEALPVPKRTGDAAVRQVPGGALGGRAAQ